jgi:predicted RNA-binding protein with PIN domain
LLVLRQHYFEAMTYIIDGHNLIGVLPDIHLGDPNDEGRLLERLRSYRARVTMRSGQMIVFFDAGPGSDETPPGIPARRPGRRTSGYSPGVEARFAGPGQTADDAIVTFLRGVPEPGQYAVVTDDQELTRRVRALGASATRASEFATRLAPRPHHAKHKPRRAGMTEEPTPDPHAPAFADLYAGFLSAEKSKTRFAEGASTDASSWTERLYTGDADEAQLAARWLGQHGGKDALEPLQDALTHADARVRAAALLALGDLGDRRALPALCDRLENDGASLARQAAAQSLGRIGDRSVEDALETAVRADPKSKVRRASREAVTQIRARAPGGESGAKPPS